MTVSISKPSLNLREELASLRNQGGYEERQFWMDGLVTNGTFDADTNWTKGTGWTISGGVATKTAGTSSVLEQDIGGVSFATYSVTLTVTRSAGVLYIRHGGNTNQGSVSSSGTFSFDVTKESLDGKLRLVADGSFAGTVDNVSVYESDGTDVVHRMPKGWVPLHVYEDGLLQREGSANDYEVVYDGFDYYVKPAVAPSATTQTCVIGVRK